MSDEPSLWEENLKGSLALLQQLLKSLELVNGGAVVAILTFYGNALKDGEHMGISGPDITDALGAFAIGLGLALTSAALAYATQLGVAATQLDAIRSQMKDAHHAARKQVPIVRAIYGFFSRWDWPPFTFLGSGAAALGSLIAFGFGVHCAMDAFSAAAAPACAKSAAAHCVAAPAPRPPAG